MKFELIFDFSDADLRGCKRKLAILRDRMLDQSRAGMIVSFGLRHIKPRLP